MANRQLPSPEVLRQLLRYDPETGKLFWKERTREFAKTDAIVLRWNRHTAGREALTARGTKGYLIGIILGARVKAHRVAWAIHYGEWPSGQLDHIDRNPANNRLANLRIVTTSQNCRNRGMRSDNRSGHTGVHRSSRGRKWEASIRMEGKTIHIGTFAALEDAVAARINAEIQVGFHHASGE